MTTRSLTPRPTWRVRSFWGYASVFGLGIALLCATQSQAEKSASDKLLNEKSLIDKSPTARKSTEKKPASLSKKKKKHKKLPIITHPKLDPKAPHVQVFDGISRGSLSVRVVPQNSFGGSVYIENTSNKPLTVEVPDGFVAVPLLRQVGGGVGRGGAAGGGAQAMGGGMGGMGMQGGMMGGGMGQFSVPPERVVKVPFHSVCLEHGKNDPDPTMRYKLVATEEYTNDDRLNALITMVGAGSLDLQSAQAAAWHLANNMSWQQLALKESTEIGQQDMPYFSPQAIVKAQQLVAEARGLAHDRAEKKKARKDEAKKDDRKPANSNRHVIEDR